MTRALLLAAVVLAGCPSSEERIQTRWDAFVAENNTCEVDADCAAVYPGCPLGCATAIRADAVEAGAEVADDLIRRYERGGRSCAYDCIPVGDPECTAEGVCGFGEWDTGQ